jgi:hypothetical protein
MQALRRTLFLCYAAADREIAARIASYLDAGAGVQVLFEEGEIKPGEELVDKAREARMADVVLVLFSRQSLPSPWPRYKWEDALRTEPLAEETRIAFLKSDDCAPPRILTPLFDLAGLPPDLAGLPPANLSPAGQPLLTLRRLKRWVRAGTYGEPVAHYPDLAEKIEELAVALADRPGTVTVESPALALEFGRLFREDFDAVIRLECGGRSLAALAGDLASQLGLRLEGDLESNLARLRSHCTARRYLLWLEGASADEADRIAPGRGSSTLISSEPRSEAPPDDESLRDIQYSFSHPGMIGDWAELCRLARMALRLAATEGRLAESFELLDRWHVLAEARDDRRILEESSREMVWILEGWDRLEEARHLEFRRATLYDDQMALPIPATAPPSSQLLLEAPPPEPIARERIPMPKPEQFRLF